MKLPYVFYPLGILMLINACTGSTTVNSRIDSAASVNNIAAADKNTSVKKSAENAGLNTASPTQVSAAISITSSPEVPPLNDYFLLNISLNSNKYAGVKAADIRIEAIMPAHQHGMNVDPVIEAQKKKQHFIARGLIFHMRGNWLVHIYISLPNATEKITLPIYM